MACGIPIIASASGETKRIIEDADCGYCSEAENAEILAANVRKFIASADKDVMGKNARNYYEKHFAKDKFFEELLSVL